MRASRSFSTSLLMLALYGAAPGAALPSSTLVPGFGQTPLVFEANRGQAEPGIKFVARGPHYRLYLRPGGAELAANGGGPALQLDFAGSNRDASIEGVDATGGQSNYLLGGDRSHWMTGIPHYQRVRYRSVYPNIDVVFYSSDRELEYDFVLVPGADPRAIQMKITGAEGMSVDGNGDLVLRMGSGRVIQRRPAIYQMRAGARRAVAGKYRVLPGGGVGFEIGRYDRGLPLWIDPVLSYATYLGGAGVDTPNAIAVDASGNVYIAGSTQSLNFPATAGVYQGSLRGGAGDTDAFITKLSADGKSVLFSTYLGGSFFDTANAIAVDATGIYVAGTTGSSNFPITSGVTQPVIGGATDAFVTKLNLAGTSLVYSTFFGGACSDFANALAVDGGGNVFIAGSTCSTDFPTSAGAFQTTLKSGYQSGDGFVAELNSTATAKLYSTYLGGGGDDSVSAIALRSSSGSTYAYVTGRTTSPDFPVTAGVKQSSLGGGQSDAFVTELKPDGTGLVYSTYLGGSGFDSGSGIAVDVAGYAYLTGQTYSADFPVTPGSYQTVLSQTDAFLTKVSPGGTALAYSTYLIGGGASQDVSIAVDSSGQAALAGSTNAYNFPVRADAFQSTLVGCCNATAYLTKFNASGTNLLYSTYLGGGTGSSYATAMATDGSGNLYVAGTTTSTDFPATAGAFQTAAPGQPDGFVAKFDFTTAAGATLVTSAPFVTFSSSVTAAGNSTPASQTISVASTGNAIPFTATAVTSSGGNWLSISTNTATTPATLTVSANPAGLATGFYSGIVSIVAPGVANGHTLVSVSLNVSKPTLNLSTATLQFSYAPGGVAPACQPVMLSNDGPPLAFTNVSTNAVWLSATPNSGNTPATVSVCVNPAGLPNGVQTGTVYILTPYASNSTSTITVNLRVGPQIQVGPSGLYFQHMAGGCATPDQSLVLSSSGAALSFSVAATSSGWLSVTPASGTTSSSLTVKVDPTGLANGSYSGTITVTAPGSVNGSVTVSVTLNIYPPSISAPGPITLIAPTGSSTVLRSDVPLFGSDSCVAQSFTATSSSAWLSVTPTSGTIAGQGSITISANPAGLADGTYTGTITITSPAAVNSPISIQVTLRVGPQIQVGASQNFVYTPGGCALAPQSITVSSTGQPLSFSAASNAAWLSVTPASGTTGSSLSVAADPRGLAPGSYNGTITVTAPGSVNGSAIVNVYLYINPPSIAAPPTVSFTAQTGSSSTLRNDINLYSGDSCLTHSFSAAASSDSGWLSVSPASGTVSSNGASLTIFADPTGKADGTYTGTITLTSATATNSPISIAVTLKVGPILTISSPAFLSFGASPGNPPPPSQGILVSSGGKSIPFTVTSSTQSGGNWLTATPASGNTPNGGGGTDISVAVNPAGLAPGSYYGSIRISSSQSLGSFLQVTVYLTVGPQLSVRASSLSFTQAPGGAAPPPQTVAISTGVAALSYSAQAVSSTGWLSVTPAFGTTPDSLTVTANGGSLPAGNYSGAITITVPGAIGSPVTINVSLTVGQSMTISPTSLFFTGLGAPDQSILVSGNAPLSNVSASAFSSGWLSVAPGLGTGFTVSANQAGLSSGTYQGYVTITAAGVANSPQTIPVTLSVPQTTLLSPANTSVSVSLSPTLTWVATPGAASYDVYIGSTSPPQFAANVTTTSYSPTGLSGTTTYYWRVVARNGNISSSSATWSFGTAVSAVALRFVPMTPCRVADTRGAAGPFGGPQIGGGSTRTFNIPSSNCGIPASAQAYLLNVAVVPGGPLGYVTVWPSGQSQPVASTLNSLDGRVKSNSAIVPAGIDGAVNVFASNSTHAVLDINGYFVPAGDPAGLAFYPVTPCRIIDTRGAAAPLGGPSLSGGQARAFPVLSSACNIPATAQAYSLNVAAVPKGPLGYVTAWPSGQAQPATSTLNAPTGAVTANAAIVPAGTGGAISVFASNSTDLVVDINGYFAPMATGGLSLYNVTPCRVRDTRQAAGSTPFTGKLDLAIAGGTCGMPVAPAYVLSATVVPSAALGYLTLWPQTQAQPVAATLNALDGAVTSNLAVVPATSGSVSAFSSNPTHLVLDMFGYFGQ